MPNGRQSKIESRKEGGKESEKQTAGEFLCLGKLGRSSAAPVHGIGEADRAEELKRRNVAATGADASRGEA